MSIIKVSFNKRDVDLYYMMKERKIERREFIINIKNYLLMMRQRYKNDKNTIKSI